MDASIRAGAARQAVATVASALLRSMQDIGHAEVADEDHANKVPLVVLLVLKPDSLQCMHLVDEELCAGPLHCTT